MAGRYASLALALSAAAAMAQAAPPSLGRTASRPAPTPVAAGSQEDIRIRPFRVQLSHDAVVDLRRRIRTTRWPERETVADRSQGVQLASLRQLLGYWGTGYDWRRLETRLNALPQYTTSIDGIEIHFIHVRSREKNAVPLIITHGWPGSVLELLNVIGPLTDPVRFGGRAEDAFDVVIPSMPGYGFSGKPGSTGWTPDRIARSWDVLMKRLGYGRYVAQGGDWGAVVAEAMGRQAPTGLLGIHVNLPAAVPDEVGRALGAGGPAPEGLSQKERAAFDALQTFFSKNRAYSVMLATRPQMIGYGLTDSPAGLAAFMYDYNAGEPERLIDRDEFLDDVTLYWLTNSAASAARLYWENGGRGPTSAAAQMTREIAVPVAVTVFPDEVYRTPETWARRAFPNLSYFHEVDRGGHFAAWEEPQLFAEEMRAAFRPLR
jgi:pimeloyl-ACP methyl ester carboxylesterase